MTVLDRDDIDLREIGLELFGAETQARLYSMPMDSTCGRSSGDNPNSYWQRLAAVGRFGDLLIMEVLYNFRSGTSDENEPVSFYREASLMWAWYRKGSFVVTVVLMAYYLLHQYEVVGVDDEGWAIWR